MRVSVALFTADLRVHDNPVHQAALTDAERVVSLCVVDGIRRTGSAGPNRAAFLVGSLADVDAVCGRGGLRATWPTGGARRRRGREPCRMAAETGAAVVHIAGGASRQAVRREDRLRAEPAGDRRGLRLHEAVVDGRTARSADPGGQGPLSSPRTSAGPPTATAQPSASSS